MDLTKRERGLLRQLKIMTEIGGGMVTRSRATAQRLSEKGLIRSLGLVVMTDGDGYTLQPERKREAWAITARGRKWLARRRRQEEEEG